MTPKPLLFIVDDEPELRSFLKRLLEADFEIIVAESAEQATQLLGQHSPDAILTDVRMPGASGIDLCKSFRSRLSNPNIPILMISALDEPETRMRSFEAGADDFIAKPFRPDELALRLQMRIRRWRQMVPGTTNIIVAGKLRIDLDRVEARVSADRISLGPVEFKILSLLARGLGQLRSRREIESFVWGDQRPASRALDPHINALRKKLIGSELELRTVYGTGYSLSVKQTS